MIETKAGSQRKKENIKCLSSVFRGAVFACIAIPASGNSFVFQTVISPGDPNFTQLLGINNSSTIAGYFGDGTVVPNNGFTLVLPNSYTPENFPGSVQTQVVGINNTGETVGFYIDTANVQHGFTDIGGSFTDVTNPQTTTVTQLLGVNDTGVTAGYWSDAAGNFHPFTFASGIFTPIPVPGLVSSQATGVNNAGDVVGFNLTNGGANSDGFLDIAGSFTTLDFPKSMFTQALGLNNVGQVVGSYVDAMNNMHGFIYDIGTGSYQSIDDPFGVGTTTVNGINDKGQLVGFYSVGTSNGVTLTDGFVATPTPEPASMLLLATVLSGAALKLGRYSIQRSKNT